jgi:hypothetical protein
MNEPELSHYPLWLRKLIFPGDLTNIVEGRESHQELIRSLKKIFDTRRGDSVNKVISELTLELIRHKFQIYETDQKIINQKTQFTDQISALETRIKKLEKNIGEEEIGCNMNENDQTQEPGISHPEEEPENLNLEISLKDLPFIALIFWAIMRLFFGWFSFGGYYAEIGILENLLALWILWEVGKYLTETYRDE